MAPDDKLSRKAEIDTTNFKTGIAEMNREMRVLESGFRASAAALGDWAEDASGLEMRIKSLNSQMEIQEKKVAATRAEYERIKAEKGENSRAAQELEIKLNKETETLGKMQTELTATEGSLQELKTGSDEAGRSVEESANQADEAGGKWEGFKSVLSGIGPVVKGVIIGITALATAAAAAVAGVGALVLKATDAASALTDVSEKTGISTTKLQEYQFIGDQVGVSLDTITGAQARLIRSMQAGRDGTGAQADAFKSLGVAITDANGNLRSTDEVFAEALDKLGGIANETERDALSMQIFGKNAQEINPLIKAGAEGMAEMADEAHRVGAVMDEDAIAGFDNFGDTLASLKAGLQGTLGSLLGNFLPGIQAFADQAGGYLQQFQDIVKGSGGDVGKIAEGAGQLIGQIITDLAAQAPQLLSAGLGLIQSLLDAIISALPTLLPAAIQIITSLIDFIVQALPTLIDAGVQILLTLVDALIANLPMLIDAGLQAVISLALGLANALPELIPAVIQAIITIVQTLVQNLPLLIDAALQLILGLAQGLVAAIPVLLPALPQIVTAIFNALVQALPMIGQAALQLLQILGQGILSNLPLLGKAAADIIEALGNGIKKLIPTLATVGKNLLDGIWSGIKNNWDNFLKNVLGVFGNLVGAIKKLLGIASPSKVGIEIGANLGASIGMGLFAQLDMVSRSMRGAIGNMTAPAFATAGANGINQQSESYAFYAPVYIQGSGEGGLGTQIKARRF